jgi:hypothetical protein
VSGGVILGERALDSFNMRGPCGGSLTDTSPEAAALQISIQRSLTGIERLRLALEMSCAARELALARLRREYPDWSEWELKMELLRYAFGPTPLPPALR